MVNYLDSRGKNSLLLSPTARAAKNISRKTDSYANTVHSAIYTVESDVENAVIRFKRRLNTDENACIYIVDESSMLGEKASPENNGYINEAGLLTDLIRYIKSGKAPHKIVFVGDPCQLPPIGYLPGEMPPALSANTLQKRFGLKGGEISLTEIMRQQEGSEILKTAIEIRQLLENNPKSIFRGTLGNKFWNVGQATDLYLRQYDAGDQDKVAIISLSNSYAQTCNLEIREKLGFTQSLQTGDRIMLKQSYYGPNGVFVANGEIGEVVSVGRVSTIEECRFMEASLTFKNERDEYHHVECQIMVDCLEQGTVLSQEKRKALCASAFRNNPTFRKSKNIWDDPYLGAMHIGYGHAFTCHKAQGGEWDTVLLNSYLHKSSPDSRFLYTGVTRARQNLYSNNVHQYN